MQDSPSQFLAIVEIIPKKIRTVARMFKEGKGEIVFEKEKRKRKIESFWPGRKKNNFAKRDGNFYRCTLSGSRILLGIICTSVHGAAIRSQKTNDPSNCQGNIGIKKEKEKKKKKKVHAFSALSRKSLSPDLLRWLYPAFMTLSMFGWEKKGFPGNVLARWMLCAGHADMPLSFWLVITFVPSIPPPLLFRVHHAGFSLSL